jgi:hypothetical protein
MLPSLSESKIGKIKIMMMQYKNVAEREETVDVFDNQYENEVLAISSQAKSSEETKSQLKVVHSPSHKTSDLSLTFLINTISVNELN